MSKQHDANVSDERCTKNNTNNNRPNKRSNRRGNNRKGNSKSMPRKGEKLGESSYTNGDVNNPSYYYSDVNVLGQVMNFSFNEFNGVPFTIDLGNNTPKTAHNYALAVYALNPSIPQSTSDLQYRMDGTTTAALRNFLALSGSNAKTTNYAPQDVVILTLALAELIKATTFIARAFGVAYLFNYRNRAYPEMLIEAMGINSVDFSKRLAEYRVRFNKLLTVASKIPFPAEIPLFRKAADLYAYIYLDDDNSAMAQTYMFVPYSMWLFDEAYDANGAGLRTFSWIQPTSTMNDVLDRLETMITSLVNSTSLNAIYSDVMRLVQNGKLSQLITFSSIPEDFVITPIYNAEVKDWIHNATIVGYPVSTSAQYYISSMHPLTNENDVCCDAGSNRLLYHPQFRLDHPFGITGLVDFDHDNVTLEDKVRATRLSQRWTTIVDNNSQWYTNDLAFNDEYLVHVFYMTGENDTPTAYYTSTYRSTSDASYTNDAATLLADLTSKFDWSPLFYINRTNSVSIMGDLDYYTLLDYDTVKKIYDYEIIHLLQIG